jgi:hypothetical protein
VKEKGHIWWLAVGMERHELRDEYKTTSSAGVVLQVAQIFKCKFKIGYILDIFLKY